jgi:hypothetical protein
MGCSFLKVYGGSFFCFRKEQIKDMIIKFEDRLGRISSCMLSRETADMNALHVLSPRETMSATPSPLCGLPVTRARPSKSLDRL